MKVVFLDIDGVLNSMDYYERTRDKGTYGINPNKVKLLKEIIEHTGAEIILSSTWRCLGRTSEEEHPMYTYLVEALAQFGLVIKEHTPMINNNRPEEIKAWLDNQTEKEIKFVSLDDDFGKDKYEKYGIGECLVRTSFYEPDGGLKREHVEMAVEILNG